MAYINHDVSTMAMPSGMNRMGQFPLDMSSVYYDEASLKAYAESGAIAYVGQIVSLVDADAGKVTVYSIQDTTGTLKEVGVVPSGDESTIVVDKDGKIALAGMEELVFERDIIGEDDQPTGDKETVQYQALLTKDGLVWVEPSKTTVEGLATLIEGLDKRVIALEGAVGNAAKPESSEGAGDGVAATGLFKAIADEEDRAKALDEAIKSIDFIDEDELEEAIKDFTTKTYVDTEVGKKVDNETYATDKKGIEDAIDAKVATSDYNTDKQNFQNAIDAKLAIEDYNADKKALDDEDAAIREIAEDAQTKVDTFMGTIESSTDVVDTLQEVIALINSEDAELSTALMGEISGLKNTKADKSEISDLSTAVDGKLDLKADKTAVEGIAGKVEALEAKPFDTYATKSEVEAVDGKFSNYTNTEALTELLAGKQDNIAEGTYATPSDVATAKGEAITDAEGKIAAAKGEAIAAAASDAEAKVKALADDAVAKNTAAITAINDAENGVLKVAKDYADEKANAAKSGAEATAAGLYATKEYVGTVPEGKGDTIVAYINKKAEETLAAAQGGSSETAASVSAALQNYKDLNDPKVAKNTTDIANLSTTVSNEAAELDALQGAVNGQGTKIATLETTVAGHGSTIEGHTQSLLTMSGDIAKNAAQTDLEAAVVRIATNEGSINVLNETTIPGINDAINLKANSDDVYTKTAVDAIIGTPVEGKTIVEMIEAAKVAATYDDTAIKEDIKKNTDAIAVLNGDDKTEGSVDYKVAQEVAKIINDNDDSDIDTLNEIAAWITNDTTGAAKMNADIVANAAAITKLNGSVETEGSVLSMIAANAPKIAAVDVAGLVKSVAATVENGVSVAEDGTMSVNSVNVNKLVQTSGETLILNGGSSNV